MHNVFYTLLILEFWVAERFIKGEFFKYNNNNGFMDDLNSIINKFL